MCSDVHTRAGTPHIKICSDVQNRVGTPHIKMCSDVQNRVGTPHKKTIEGYGQMVEVRWGHRT